MSAPECHTANAIDVALERQMNRPVLTTQWHGSFHPRVSSADGRLMPIDQNFGKPTVSIGLGSGLGLQHQDHLHEAGILGVSPENQLPPGYSYSIETKKDGSKFVKIVLPRDFRLQNYGQMFHILFGEPKRGEKNYDILWKCIALYEEHNFGKTGSTMETYPGIDSFQMPLEKLTVQGKPVDGVCGVPVSDLLQVIYQNERKIGKLVDPPMVVTTATARPTAVVTSTKKSVEAQKTPTRQPTVQKTQILPTVQPSLSYKDVVETRIADGTYPDPDNPTNQLIATTLLCSGLLVGVPAAGALLSAIFRGGKKS